MSNKSKINKKKIFIAIVVIIFIIYIFYMAYLLIGNETDTFIVKEGTLYKEETVARVHYKR